MFLHHKRNMTENAQHYNQVNVIKIPVDEENHAKHNTALVAIL